MKFTFLLLLVLTSAHAREDGVMVDENGLTIKLNQPAVVDTTRWSFSDNTYKRIGKESLTVQIAMDDKYNIVATELKGFDTDDGIYTDGAIIDKSGMLVTSELCEQFNKKEIVKKALACQDLEKSIADIYVAQYSNPKLLNGVMKLTDSSKAGTKKLLQDEANKYEGIFQRSREDKSKDRNNNNLLDQKILTYMIQKCPVLERYSTKTEALIPVVAQPISTIAK